MSIVFYCKKTIPVFCAFLFVLCQANTAFAQKLFGMTAQGGWNNGGVIFEYNVATASYTKRFDFDVPGIAGVNGTQPHGSLMQACNGKLYGMTSSGGQFNKGVLFELNPITNVYHKRFDFNGSNGAFPTESNSLMQASNGKLYGMTANGGNANTGVLFEYDPYTFSYSKKVDFDFNFSGSPGTNGAYPLGSLMEAANGKLYGMTSAGGINNGGILFEFDPNTDVFSKKWDFSFPNGNNPRNKLMQASNGKLYGMTWGGAGGPNSSGVIFEFDVNLNVYTKKFDFIDYFPGSDTYGGMMEAANGKLYGTTAGGGDFGGGVVFEYDIATNGYNKIAQLIYQPGGHPLGSFPSAALLQASNGKFYGTTNGGGVNGGGVIFECSEFGNYNRRFNFLQSSGYFPTIYSHLIEVTGPFSCAAPVTAAFCSNVFNSLTTSLTGTNYQWQLKQGSSFINISDNGNYTGTNTGTLELNYIPYDWEGRQYRCLVDGANDVIYEIRFLNTWTGIVNSAWEHAGNWSCGFVPTINMDVVIPADAPNMPTIQTMVYCKKITINTGATLIVGTNGVLNTK